MSASKSETGKRRDEETAGRDNEAVAHPSASRHGPDVSSLPRSETYDLRPATRDPRPAAIALGANLGDRIGQLRAAVVALDAHPDVTEMARSPVSESEAQTLDGTAQPAYLNAVLTVATTLAPEALLGREQHVEQG
ncbi:MAG: 2-amino-4-hydroxy-6-hydroxymethyldihydropteridine diphosphokinase, partial [Bacteroidota bacterium]